MRTSIVLFSYLLLRRNLTILTTCADDSANSGIRLRGSLPIEMKFLTHVERLIISDFNLEGRIFDIVADMSNLNHLEVPENELIGSFPSTFAEDHPRLLWLDLHDNMLVGPVPSGFETLTVLNMLDLSENKFNGQLPNFGAIPTLGTFSPVFDGLARCIFQRSHSPLL